MLEVLVLDGRSPLLEDGGCCWPPTPSLRFTSKQLFVLPRCRFCILKMLGEEHNVGSNQLSGLTSEDTRTKVLVCCQAERRVQRVSARKTLKP